MRRPARNTGASASHVIDERSLEPRPWLAACRFMSASFFDAALGILKAVGPFVLLGFLVYGVLRWRHRSRAEEARGEQKTKELYTNAEAQRDTLSETGHDSSQRSERREGP
jgi:hypothetical protein